jgi:hypothetical protein
MPKRTITSASNKAATSGFLDLLGAEQSDFEAVKLDTIADSMEYVAAVYTEKLNEQLRLKDADSSGDLAKSIVALDVVILGTVYTVEIESLRYASYIDEGVDGWANSRGSQFKFKKSTRKRGEPFTGKSAFVESLKKYLDREGKIGRLTKKVQISDRERKRAKITDASTKAAIAAAYMIKRQGIAPNHFWRDATKQMDEIIKKEFSAALKIDIINNLTNN